MWLAFNLLLLICLPGWFEKTWWQVCAQVKWHPVLSDAFCQMTSSFHNMWKIDMHFCRFKFPAGRYDRSLSAQATFPRPFNFHFRRMRQVGQLKGDKCAMASLTHQVLNNCFMNWTSSFGYSFAFALDGWVMPCRLLWRRHLGHIHREAWLAGLCRAREMWVAMASWVPLFCQVVWDST